MVAQRLTKLNIVLANPTPIYSNHSISNLISYSLREIDEAVSYFTKKA